MHALICVNVRLHVSLCVCGFFFLSRAQYVRDKENICMCLNVVTTKMPKAFEVPVCDTSAHFIVNTVVYQACRKS